MRTALQSEQTKVTMKATIKQLEADTKDLERKVEEVKAKCDALQQKEAERREQSSKAHEAIVDGLSRGNANLKKELEVRLSVPSDDI